MPSYKFHKSERLTNKKRFETLFQNGLTINAYPLKLIYILEEPSEFPPLQMAFSVPKRTFRKAVHRNFLKRRMREAFRLLKPELYSILEGNGIFLYGILIYVDKEKKEFPVILQSMKKLLAKMQKKHFKDL